MKWQLCVFKRNHLPPPDWEPGLALVQDFGCYDVAFIVDMSGDKVPAVWDYRLEDGPLCYIDVNYDGRDFCASKKTACPSVPSKGEKDRKGS